MHIFALIFAGGAGNIGDKYACQETPISCLMQQLGHKLYKNNIAHTYYSRDAVLQVSLPPLYPTVSCSSMHLMLTLALSSFFKTLVDHEVTVELKNDVSIKGTLKSVDQFLNIKLDDIQVAEELKYPHLVG